MVKFFFQQYILKRNDNQNKVNFSSILSHEYDDFKKLPLNSFFVKTFRSLFLCLDYSFSPLIKVEYFTKQKKKEEKWISLLTSLLQEVHSSMTDHTISIFRFKRDILSLKPKANLPTKWRRMHLLGDAMMKTDPPDEVRVQTPFR